MVPARNLFGTNIPSRETVMRWHDYHTIDTDSDATESGSDNPTSGSRHINWGNNILSDIEQELIHHQPGRSEINQSTRLALQDKIRITGQLCNELAIPEHQRAEAQLLMARLNLDKFGSQKRIEKVALTVIRHIDERDRMSGVLVRAPRIASTDRFKMLLNENGMDHGDVMRISTVLKEQLREID